MRNRDQKLTRPARRWRGVRSYRYLRSIRCASRRDSWQDVSWHLGSSCVLGTVRDATSPRRSETAQPPYAPLRAGPRYRAGSGPVNVLVGSTRRTEGRWGAWGWAREGDTVTDAPSSSRRGDHPGRDGRRATARGRLKYVRFHEISVKFVGLAVKYGP